MTKAEQPTITQADREAAADLIEVYWSGANEGMMKLAKSYRAGHSHGAFVRAFAKHRTTSLAAQDGLVEAELREAIETAITQRAIKIIRGDNESDLHNCLEQYAEVATQAALSAIKGDKS